MHRKIIDPGSIRSIVSAWQASGLQVGCISGSFDVIGARHFATLAGVRQQCDRLVVLLNSDYSVRSYKGEGKPVLHQDERSYILAQSEAVDAVVIFDEVTPLAVLERVQPNVYFNASEWGKDCIERPIVEAYGGRVEIFNIDPEPTWAGSSTILTQKIADSLIDRARPGIFLDRDGTLNDNGEGYINRFEDIRLLPEVIEGLRKLAAAGYPLFVVTNQSGVARGYYPETNVQELHKQFAAHLAEQGIAIADWYYCPHDPDAGCDCRKPGIGMLLQAARTHNLNLSKSWFIGDSETDVGAARNANVRSILIGDAAQTELWRYRPHHVALNFLAATDIILAS